MHLYAYNQLERGLYKSLMMMMMMN